MKDEFTFSLLCGAVVGQALNNIILTRKISRGSFRFPGDSLIRDGGEIGGSGSFNL